MTNRDLIALCVIGAAVVYSFGHNGNLLLVLAALIWLFD
jgi:hypothetical protein